MIYRWHNGYIHRDRPPALRLLDRTYVFGDWERRLLIDHSVYRDRTRSASAGRRGLTSCRPAGPTDRDADPRAELGIAPATAWS